MDERGNTHLCDLLAAHTDDQPSSSERVQPTQYFVVLSGVLPRELVMLETGIKTVGRAPENDLQVHDMSVSRTHASIAVDDDRHTWLTDLGSTNGTFVNGQRLGAHQTVGLRDGDRVGLGPHILLKYVSTDAIDANHHRKLYERSVRDPLTGLYNRAYFLNQMSFVVDQTYRRDLGLAVVMLDIDHFKRINDAHGHEAGDAVLRFVASVLRQSTRSKDLVARYGGEEFVAALPATSSDQAWGRADRIRQALKSQAIAIGRESVSITGSIGVAFGSPDRPRPIDRLIRAADRSLYAAKNGGRDRVVLDVPGSRSSVAMAPGQIGTDSVFDAPNPRTGHANAACSGLTTADFDAWVD